MGEVVNVLVAFAVIVFIFRWVTSGSDSPEQQSADVLGFRPKPVTQGMIDTIQQMFPDIPADNIRYDLLRTGSVEATSNKVLERGLLEAPPAAYYTLYPRNPAAATARAQGTPVTGTSTPAAQKKKKPESLIERYHLEERAKKVEEIKEDLIGGKAVWEDSPEKREASLRERKAQMVLAARQRMLAQQQKEAEAKAKTAS